MRGSAVVMVKCLILCRLLLIFVQGAAMHRTGILVHASGCPELDVSYFSNVEVLHSMHTRYKLGRTISAPDNNMGKGCCQSFTFEGFCSGGARLRLTRQHWYCCDFGRGEGDSLRSMRGGREGREEKEKGVRWYEGRVEVVL